MIYKPANPFSIVLFLVSLLIGGIFWTINWVIAQCQRLIGKVRPGRQQWQHTELLMR